jgi:hypothetical protein
VYRLIGQAGELKTHVDSGFESQYTYHMDEEPYGVRLRLESGRDLPRSEDRALSHPPFLYTGVAQLAEALV